MSDNPILKFTIYGDPRTKKNSPIPIRMRTKSGQVYSKILPSKQFTQYEKNCLKQITGKHRLNIGYRINICYKFFMETHRIVDETGLQQSLDDILKDARVIEDDNARILAGHDGTRVYYDKDNPRVEIIITKLEEVDNEYQLV